jgi:cytochrome bd-type quinol oxidase subunit 1
MEFQFGTNWARYARFVGDIFGSPLAIEGIYAFFLESGLLALLLFGWHKIGPRMHFFSTCLLQMVAADSTARGVSRDQPTKLAAMGGLGAFRGRVCLVRK